MNKAMGFIGLGDAPEMLDEEVKETKKDLLGIDLGQFKSKMSKKSSSTDTEISIYEPKAYENSIEISAKLRQGSPVIVNIKYLDQGEGTRLVDFVCGAAFAIDGHMMKIADTIFLLTPSDISITDMSGQSSDMRSDRDGMFGGRN